MLLNRIFDAGVGGRKQPSAAEALRMEFDMMNLKNVDDKTILCHLGVCQYEHETKYT
jgi:hypothetical protein